MSDPPSIEALSEEIRRLYRSNPVEAPVAIEGLLAERLKTLPASQRGAQLHAIAEAFRPRRPAIPAEKETQEAVFSKIFSLLLGREVSSESLSSSEIMERLSEALHTLFATLNRLIQTIDATLLGDGTADQTIRKVIGSRLEGAESPISLEEYLGRIDKAFLITHQAFRMAAQTVTENLLRELDPERIAAAAGQRLAFGPLKKAEYFDIYKSKFSTLKKWFDSGRFMDDLLREFENHCHR
jgi:uncharacterized protein (DUF2267 family)